MANSDPSDLPLKEHHLKDIDLSNNERQKIQFASELFRTTPPEFYDPKGSFFPPHFIYQSYFSAIIDELSVFTPEKHFIKTVGDLFVILDVVRQSFSKPKQHVIDQITAFARQHDRNDDFLSEKVEASVELAAKWWFLADFQTYSDRLGDAAGQPWPANRSLSKQIEATICDDNEDLLDDKPNRLFSRRFTLFDMDWLRLIKIRWTNNIAQHLYLEEWKDRDFNRTVYVFSHTAMMESVVQDLRLTEDCNDVKEFLKETMDTVDLLMDLQDPEARKWYRKIRKTENAQREKLQLPTEALDVFAGFPKRGNSLLSSSNVSELRRVGHYKHWQHRLLRLEKAFEESKPTTLLGWWRDRRNLAYWATFVSALLALLVALLAVLLSIASVVTGPMSVDLAKKANALANEGKGLAEEANDLARQDLLDESGPPDASSSTTATATISTTIPTTTETQTIVIVVQDGCCNCAKCQAGDATMKGPKGGQVETLTTEQVAGISTCTTSIGNER